MRQLIIAALLAAGTCASSLAQMPAPSGAPLNNEQVALYFRQVLASGGTQAVIQAISEALQQAVRQGPPSVSEMAQVNTSAAGSSATVPAFVPKTWTDYVTLKGDVRYRVETIQDNAKFTAAGDNYTRQRDRIRARLGADVKINDDVKAVIRLTTDEAATVGGGGDPVSGNQTLGGGSSKKGVYLDLAYLDWNLFGEGPSELHGLAGKMANPFITQNDDLVWDPDLTPEGLALKGTLDLAPVTLQGNAGYFWLAERDARDSVSMFGVQGAARIEFMPEVALTVGTGFFSFQNVEGADVLDFKQGAPPFSYGNSVTNPTSKTAQWQCDYNVLQPFAQLELWPTVFGRVVPVSVFGQAVENMAADQYSSGYMYGLSLGKAKNPGTFECGVSYAHLEKDATLGMWTDSDRWGGGTDGEGYKLYGKYQIMKNLQAGATYFTGQKQISSSNPVDYDRCQIDLVASF